MPLHPTSRLFRRLLPLLIAGWFAGSQALHAQFNQRTEAVSKMLGPSPLKEKGTAADLEAVRARLVYILAALEKSYRSNGPKPESLLENAYEMRQDVGHQEKILTSAAILKAWRDASAMGLFNEEGGFQTLIQKGRGNGQRAIFEHVVPPEAYPLGSAHLANIRIVDPERQRAKGAEMTPQEKAYQEQLVKVVAEIASRKSFAKVSNPPPLNSLGQTKEQEDALWKAEKEAAGEDFNKKPNIRLRGRVSASPSHMSKGCWEVTAEITNLSPYPTEVELHYSIVGITDKKRDHYRMAEGTKKLQLRPGQSAELVLPTRAESSYKAAVDKHDGLSKAEAAKSKVRYRGFVLQIHHGKDNVGHAVTDRGLLEYTEDSGSLSRLAAY